MTEPADILLFSYGTLRLASVQLSSFGRLLDGEDDAMTGYRTDKVEITDPEVLRKSGERFHLIVVPSEKAEDEVPGKVLRITAKELAAADAYEVSDYKRVQVFLKSGRHAFVYVKA
ncbi:UDP-N-acetylmuramate--alanine ligase [Shinella sp. SUS2]|uniref:gamma-glutamylcyclotransferase family protein n=1 Tax=unclassified Shinella TaxID=2643062 RepID=UPI000683223E|nr:MULTISPECIES: gamma-glutamylcyclotransferase family protein [unclassified Shinella]KNY17997.1 UDP-N-acetylmuramate--alanine ligase [Shinella sp. SUS2]KOC75610.1 UDP-N-acetylmuramate--alanine ligase [Shinella sp. GWS1]